MDAYSTGVPGTCSRFLVESELLIYFCYFVLYYYFSFFMFFVVIVCDISVTNTEASKYRDGSRHFEKGVLVLVRHLNGRYVVLSLN